MINKGKDTKPHIGIFGRRNNGKSSIINTLINQNIAIVSDTPGTTTDPVKKSFEIPGIGPCVLIDTAGIDDEGELGNKRIEKSKEIIKQIDLAVLVIAGNIFGNFETDIISIFNNNDVPYIILHNKSDIEKISTNTLKLLQALAKVPVINFSTIHLDNLEEFIQQLQKAIPETAYNQPSMLGGLVKQGDIVLLITPIDVEAPDGRLILPQVQAIRETLDNDCIAIVCKEREVDTFLKTSGIKPTLVIADSSVLLKANASIPNNIPLTGFSIMLARHKGDFDAYLEGTPKISNLKNGDRILLLESCSHHVSCDDIGRVKIPRWISNFTGKKLEFDVVAGLNRIERPIDDYALIIQCGGCMITRKQLINRLKPAKDSNIAITNYGMAIAYVHGVYERAIKPFTNDVNYDDII